MFIQVSIFISIAWSFGTGFLYRIEKETFRVCFYIPSQRRRSLLRYYSLGERLQAWVTVTIQSPIGGFRDRGGAPWLSARKRFLQEGATRLERVRVEDVSLLSCNCNSISSGLVARAVRGFFPSWVFPRTSRRSVILFILSCLIT